MISKFILLSFIGAYIPLYASNQQEKNPHITRHKIFQQNMFFGKEALILSQTGKCSVSSKHESTIRRSIIDTLESLDTTQCDSLLILVNLHYHKKDSKLAYFCQNYKDTPDKKIQLKDALCAAINQLKPKEKQLMSYTLTIAQQK